MAFNDQLDGMEDQMRTLAQMGLISTFLGMLPGSRSFLSFPRHEYFRRLFCRIVGRWQTEGHVPDDPDILDDLVLDVFPVAKRFSQRLIEDLEHRYSRHEGREDSSLRCR